MLQRLLIATLLTTTFVASLSAQPWMKAPYINKSKQEANFYEIQHAFNAWWGDKPYEKGKGYKQFKRWEYITEPFCFPDGEMPKASRFIESYYRAVEDAGENKNSEQANWVPMGISTWTNGYSGYNPGNGRINFIAEDPTDSNILYVASPSGGIWKTTNGGTSWNTTFDDQPQLGTSCIAIHPTNPSTVFVGTGDKDSWDTYAMGIMKSTDNGNTWIDGGLNSGLNYNNINKILINPENPNTMLVATPSNIFRSIDGGNNWTAVYSGTDIRNMLYKPGDTTTIYCGGNVFLKSTNGGLTFVPNTNIPNDTCRVEIAVTAANTAYVYVLASNSSNSFGGVYRSTDSGSSFSLRANSPNLLGYSEIGDDDAGQAWYDLAIAASPQNANEVFVGGVNVWKSTDGGSNWDISSHWVYGGSYGYTHADIHYLEFYGNRLYCGSDGGAFVSHDFGNTWNDISSGLEISQFYAFSNSHANENLVVCGAQDNGSNMYNNGSWTHVFGADGFDALCHYTDQNTFYASYQSGGILRTTDGGANFDYINTTGQDGSWLTPIAMHPTNSNIIYIGLEDLFKSNDAGNNWINLTNGLTGGDKLDELSIAPTDANYIYFSENDTLYYSSNGGNTWNASKPSGSFYITGISVSSTDPQKLWICSTSSSGDRVMESTDGAQTWSNITFNTNGLGINCIIEDTHYPGTLYIGTQTGVFLKDSSMSNWIAFDDGLPTVIVRELEITASGSKLRAATYGRGMWESNVYQATATDELSDIHIDIYPNPATDIVNIHSENSVLPNEIYIFNVSGELVSTSYTENNRSTLNVENLAPGNYYLRFDMTNGRQEIRKIVVMH
ncbi:MAG: T9SS type A sorting domain-containing protein [Bacteroidales bacterium]|nr:T9SS type A sorting domain-containing protein [Bacteroidales bacterium]